MVPLGLAARNRITRFFVDVLRCRVIGVREAFLRNRQLADRIVAKPPR
jgi:hypothetical protein